jgi:hypothetical protein
VAQQSIERLLEELILPPELRQALLESATRLIHTKTEAAQKQVRSVGMRKAKLEAREVVLTEAFAAGELSLMAYRTVMTKLRARISALEAVSVQYQLDPSVIREKVNATLKLAERFSVLYREFNDTRRSKLLRLVFLKVVLEKGVIVSYQMRPPFDALFADRRFHDSFGDSSPRSPFDNRQVRPAIISILEHDVDPLLRMSNDDAAAA